MPELSPTERQSMVEHIKSHAEYPATKHALIEACNNMEEFSDEHKRWFAKALPARTYKNATEVIKALKL